MCFNAHRRREVGNRSRNRHDLGEIRRKAQDAFDVVAQIEVWTLNVLVPFGVVLQAYGFRVQGDQGDRKSVV